MKCKTGAHHRMKKNSFLKKKHLYQLFSLSSYLNFQTEKNLLQFADPHKISFYTLSFIMFHFDNSDNTIYCKVLKQTSSSL